MKIGGMMLVLGAGCLPLIAEEKTSAARIDRAQQGLADGTWPRKPDNRISDLSGKMKDVSTITPRSYGQGTELAMNRVDFLEKEAPLVQRPRWEESPETGWGQARWEKPPETSYRERVHPSFRAGPDEEQPRRVDLGQVIPKSAPDWASRSARFRQGEEGQLQMYEGRLTRVREQVWREEEAPRDLGASRQETFQPEEVEKILAGSAPGGGTGRIKEPPPEAVPPAAAGN